MLCSFSTSKSGSSSWLDRLRSSKGFPAADHADLEQFLNHRSPTDSSGRNLPNSNTDEMDDPNYPSNSDLPQSDETLQEVDRNRTDAGVPEERAWFGVVSNVLSELFNMGGGNGKDSSRFNGKKVCRKQRNPKIYVNEVDAGDDGVSPSNFNDLRDAKQMDLPLKVTENEDVNADLSAFSRTEVTVIDTSFPSWKFEKMLFRRKNVWRVRDKKCKAVSSSRRRKRKVGLLNDNENAAAEGTMKLCGSSSIDANGEEALFPHSELGHGNKMEEACNISHEEFCLSPEERSLKKLKSEGSSVILIKNIPTAKKTGAVIPKSCPKSIQKQHKSY